jgi:hypothetical protein
MNKIYLLEDKKFDIVFKRFWKEKFLILIVTVIFSLLFYFYNPNLKQKFRTEIVIKNPPVTLFLKYDSFFRLYLPNYFFLNSFIDDLKNNLLSKSNLEKFLEQSKDFKNSDFLKKKNNKNNYIDDFKLTTNHENKYYLIFPEGVNGKVLLNAYIEYTKNVTLIQSKSKLKIILKEVYSIMVDNSEFLNKNQILSLQQNFYLDSSYNLKTIDSLIVILNNKIETLDKHNFNYDIILIDASHHSFVNPIFKFYHFFGIVLGFFLALLTVIFRDIIKSK